MSRSTGAALAQRRKAVAAMIAEALRQMNTPLRQKVEKMAMLIAETREINLRYYHTLGRHVRDIIENKKGVYGDRPMEYVYVTLPMGKRTLRRTATFAELYTVQDLEELINAHDPETGFSLHWGHVGYLLSIPLKTARRHFVQRTLDNMWDPNALHAAIKRQYGSRVASPHGRKHTMPKTIHLQIRQIMESTRMWVGKLAKVWNGDEYNVIANIMAAAPEELGEADLENLDTILELLPQMSDGVNQLTALVRQARERVNDVVSAKAMAELAEERQESDFPGREPRQIQLDEPSRDRPTRRRREVAMAS